MDTISDLYQLDAHTDRILVTCALPYVNNVPHLGNMVPLISADTYARYLRLKGVPSAYICATDEHGTRTEIEAAKAGLDEDTYCRRIHADMQEIFRWFHIEFDHFGRTSCPQNHALTQRIFSRADANGFILEEEIEQLQCVTCDRFLPDTYVLGECPHCHTKGVNGDQCDNCGRFLDPLELIEPQCKICGSTPTRTTTRHLALRLDALSDKLKSWIESQKHWEGIIRNMPLGWIQEGLRPRAITRDLKWGVSVPREDYADKVFYVWFDAPIGYIASTAEWAEQTGEDLDAWWRDGKARLVHFMGKDNVPFHTLIWPASLMAADEGWNLPDYIASNEYLNYEGGAFSKSRNRGVFSKDVTEMDFPADAWRFYIIANRPEKRDTDFSFEAFGNLVNASLVGNVGNLVNRVCAFTAKRFKVVPEPGPLSELDQALLDTCRDKSAAIDRAYANFQLRQAARLILELADEGNRYFQRAEPWATFKTDRATCATTLHTALTLVHTLAGWLWPIMPERAEAIFTWIGCEGDRTRPLEVGAKLPKPKYLFSTLDDDVIAALTARFQGGTDSNAEAT